MRKGVKKMIDKKKLLPFLITARTKTYAGGSGIVTPVLPGSRQMEYTSGGWLYRDIFNMGNGIFMGLETVYLSKKPVWSMSYYGNFQGMTEEEIDTILRQALIENCKTTRLWHKVHWKKNDYEYTCIPDGSTSIDELGGTEEIYKKGKRVYFFYYAGGYIG